MLIRRAQAAKETQSGILIPEQAQGKLNEGTVVAVAPATKEWTPSVKSGDRVLLNEYGGTKVQVEGEDLMLFPEEQLLGVLTGK